MPGTSAHFLRKRTAEREAARERAPAACRERERRGGGHGCAAVRVRARPLAPSRRADPDETAAVSGIREMRAHARRRAVAPCVGARGDIMYGGRGRTGRGETSIATDGWVDGGGGGVR